jgi:hypothetical protein
MVDRLVDVAELSTLTSYGQARLRELAKAGVIPCYRTGERGRFKFRPAEVMECLKRGQPAGA